LKVSHNHQTGSSEGSYLDHGAALIGLSDDDHTQYLKADGTRNLTGNMAVTAGVTIDGVDISAKIAAYIAGSLRQDVTVCAGIVNFSASTTATVTLPFTYTNANTYVAFATNNASSGSIVVLRVQHDSSSQITIVTNSSGSPSVGWVVIGY